MKKIITLLFILAFTSTSFATRILTIRNSSNVIKNFYALEMIHRYPGEIPGPYLHVVAGHYVQLKPGEFITFSNFDPININDFGYCPAPLSKYTMIPNPEPLNPLDQEDPPRPLFPYLPTSTFQWHIPYNDAPRGLYKALKCDDVPQLPSSLGRRVILRGFKIANQGPKPTDGVDYLIAKGRDYMHTYHDISVSASFNIRETFLQLPPKNPTLEIHEIIFL